MSVDRDTGRGASALLPVLGYFVVFFAAMTLGGFLFLLGGVALILIPGSLPLWAEIGYVLVGLAGTITIGILAANGAYRRRAPAATAPTSTPARPRARVLAWLAGIAGTVIGGVLSAALATIVTNYLDRS